MDKIYIVLLHMDRKREEKSACARVSNDYTKCMISKKIIFLKRVKKDAKYMRSALLRKKYYRTELK